VFKVRCTLVEPPSANDADECGADRKLSGSGSGSSDCSVQDTELDSRQRNMFEKTRSRIERNLHVLNPLVTAVSQLGQEMLGGIEIMDFDSPRYIYMHDRVFEPVERLDSEVKKLIISTTLRRAGLD